MSTSELRRGAGGPMYHQLRQVILARIRRGEFPPGSMLPSENQLCEQYGVSVTTARRAFLELVKEGVVRRKAGVGTIVAPKVRRARLAFVSVDYVGDAWRHISSVMGEIIAGVGEYAWRHDASLNIVGVEDNEAAGYLRSLVEERPVDGVLLRVANDIREEYLEILEEAGFPYVVIKRHIPGRRMNCIVSNDVTGARMATSHLLKLGLRRIGFVCAKPHIGLSRERLIGYREALDEEGIGFDEDLVRQEPYFTIEKGHEAVRSLLQIERPPEAIFVASDTMALGAYEAAQELGLRIPEDLALVGYDDIAPVAVLQPPLTTVRTSYYDFGWLASQLLLEFIEGRELPPQQRLIEPSLIVRGSTVTDGRSSWRPAPHKESEGKTTGQRSRSESGRLEGKVVEVSGDGAKLVRNIAEACELEGARMILGCSGESANVMIHVFTLRDLGAGLHRALERGRIAVAEMSGRGEGCLLLVADLTGLAGGAEYEAARAGLGTVVRDLSEEASESVRINAVLSTGREVGGPVTFLASEEAGAVSGQTLALESRSLGRTPEAPHDPRS